MSINQQGSASQSLDTISDGEQSVTTTPTQIHRKNYLGHVSAALATKLSENDDTCEICQEPFVAAERIIERHCCHLLTHVSCLSEWAEADQVGRQGALAQNGPTKTFSCPKCRRLASRANYFGILDRAFPPVIIRILGQALEVPNLVEIVKALDRWMEEQEKGESKEMTRTSTTRDLEAGAGTSYNAGGWNSRVSSDMEEYTEDEISEDEQDEDGNNDNDIDNYEDDDFRNLIWAEVDDILMYVGAVESEMPDATEIFLLVEERRALIPELRRRLENVAAKLSEAESIETTVGEEEEEEEEEGEGEGDPAIQELRFHIEDAGARLDEAARRLGLE
jgi:Ring finger domain